MTESAANIPRDDLTVIVVAYHTRDLIGPCLESVLTAADGLRVAVYVVENGSQDGSVEFVREHFAAVNLIDPGSNLGFVGGNNLVLDELLKRGTAGRYVLLLNPDTIVRPDTFRVMIAFMDATPAAGAATCRVDLASGGLDWACHRGFPTPWSSLTHMLGLQRVFPRSPLFARYHRKWQNLSTTHEVDAITGAFFLVRREAFEQVGALDTDYFMFGEDIDWAFRLKAAGWKVFYHPGTSILHYKGVSTGLKAHSGRLTRATAERKARVSGYFAEAMRIFYDKHLAANDSALVRWLVRGGIGARRRLEAWRYRFEGLLSREG